MRFWWRAMGGHLPPEELKKKESEIFGGSGEREGRSKFSIRIKSQELYSSKDKLPDHPIIVRSSNKVFRINILEYLCYGTYEYQRKNGNVFTRDYIKSGEKVSVFVSCYSEIVNEVKSSFELLSTFGGLGSRSRNGFGSFKIQSIGSESDNFYSNLEKSSYTSNLPKYSAFSQGIRLWKTKQFDKWDDALAELGVVYKNARNKLEAKYVYDKKQYIASPIIVGKIQKSIMERRAKPYFMSVHNENNKYIGYMLHIPSEYAYGKEKIDNTKETKNFIKVCKEFNDILSKNLKEAIL